VTAAFEQEHFDSEVLAQKVHCLFQVDGGRSRDDIKRCVSLA